MRARKFFYILQAYYYWFMLIVYVISLFVPRFQRGVASAFLMLLIGFIVFSQNRLSFQKPEWIVLLYMGYCVVTGIRYLTNGMPLIIYATGLAYMLFPIFFCFIHNKEVHMVFYKKTFSSLFWSMIISLVLFFWAPAFYGNYLVAHGNISNPGKGWIQTAIQGIYGITATGTFAACCGIYFYHAYLENRKKSELVKFVISVGVLTFTTRRSAIIAFWTAFLLENIWIFVKEGKKRKRLICIVIFLGISAFFAIGWHFDFMMKLFYRLMAITTVFSERNGNWLDNLNGLNLFDIILGTGYGTKSHTAGVYGFVGVYDNSYLEMFIETGLIGIGLFSAVISYTFIAGKRYAGSMISLLIIIIFALQAIGSNVFEFQILAPLFWYSVGRCINKEQVLTDEKR